MTGFVCILTLLILFCAGCSDKEENEQKEGQTATDFTLTDTEGIQFSLSDYRGEIVILDFMATWCGPCIKEMDHLKDIQEDYHDKDVRIISIDVDDSESSEDLSDLKDMYGCNWRFAYKGGSVGNTYGASAIPTLYIIDKEGEISYKSVGLTDYSTLAAELDKLVGSDKGNEGTNVLQNS